MLESFKLSNQSTETIECTVLLHVSRGLQEDLLASGIEKQIDVLQAIE